MTASPSLALPATPAFLVRLRQFAAAHAYVCACLLTLVWTCAVRLPFLHILHDDEAFYSVVASRWLRGEIPYVASFDIKAPGIFALFAAIQAVFGVSLYVIKGTEIVFTALGALGLYHLLSRHVSMRSAILAAFLYPVYSLALNGFGLPCEIVQATTKIWAFAWAADAVLGQNRHRRAAWAALSGLMMGCAVLLKQTAVFEGAGLFGWLAWHAWQKRDGAPLAAFVGGGAAPVLAFVGYFASMGHLGDVYNDVIVLACKRSQLSTPLSSKSWYVELFFRLALMTYAMLPIGVLSAGVMLASLRRNRLNASGCTVINVGLIWYTASMVGVLINRMPELQYIMALISPSLLLFCVSLCEIIRFPSHSRRTWIFVAAVFAACQPLFALPVFLKPRDYSDYRGAITASQALRGGGLKSGDSTLVISRGHYIYVLAHTLPNSRYFNAMHLLCEFPVPDRDSIETAFASRPQYVVLSDPTLALGCAKLARMRRIQAKLASDYTLMTTVHGDWDSFLLYRRKPQVQALGRTASNAKR